MRSFIWFPLDDTLFIAPGIQLCPLKTRVENGSESSDDDDDDDKDDVFCHCDGTVSHCMDPADQPNYDCSGEEGDDDDDDDEGRETSSATLPTSIFDVMEEAIDTSTNERECHLIIQELERLLQIIQTRIQTRKNSLAATTSKRR
mmetsp:Transcript_64555/g.72154  ORF Transcript_64555/g.72154 Transcript_64555/m.72154 type:complete len:145 (+) Transcript_64555:422-856(+)